MDINILRKKGNYYALFTIGLRRWTVYQQAGKNKMNASTSHSF